ncbi:hypothetical protein [Burkholderia glumae]|uniref:hypothetical protein n=1 Tax=Burkholderia glumae TaxID=337 RepID=UPI0001A4ADFB|nr:hypothetical protein [Burkholderia glumae]ACR28679.1 Hypothetical protein bglu_1g15370 [Burkholderia glumae BGR1]QGA37552.1 hypothetical protein GAS19_07750 [Burkholderia glumae]
MLAPTTENAAQFWSDRQHQQFNDAADAIAERNEAIAERVTFDVLPFTTEQIAQLDAALRRGWTEDVMLVWDICTGELQAEIARRIAAADRAEGPLTKPRYPMTYCSQCGAELGPGNSGVSHCSDHGAPPREV